MTAAPTPARRDRHRLLEGARGGAPFEYYKAPEKTAGAYTGNYFTLGDVGYVDADGYLFLTDRSAHLIISGGVNIYPAEVEAVLIGHPAVGDVGVVGVPDDDWGEIVVAVVEPQPGVAPSRRARPPSWSSGAASASRTTSVPAVSNSPRRCPGTTTASSTSTSCASSSEISKDHHGHLRRPRRHRDRIGTRYRPRARARVRGRRRARSW